MPPNRLAPGTILRNRYLVKRALREGGFGIIYLCKDQQLRRACAIKQNLDDTPQASEQFLREARILSGLSHPNLPGVSDLFDLPAGQFFVMDYIAGDNLQDLMDAAGKPFSSDRVLEWLPQMLSAVQHLHDQTPHPIIHRDIKPANFILTPDDVLFLVDFGIARVSQPGVATELGARGVSEGYAPPEQYARVGTTPRSDQYALAATLYALLTCVQPPASPMRFPPDPLQPASHFTPTLPPAVDGVLARALSIDPASRYASVNEFGAEFQAALQDHSAFRLNTRDPASEIHTLGDLFDLCDTSRAGWEAARKALTGGRMAACLTFLGIDPSVIQSAQHPQPDRALALLLQRLGQSKAQAMPHFDHAVVFAQLRNGADADVALHNPNPSGLVSGELQPVVEWIEIPQPRFSLLPGEQTTIQVRVMPSAYAAALARGASVNIVPEPFVIVRD